MDIDRIQCVVVGDIFVRCAVDRISLRGGYLMVATSCNRTTAGEVVIFMGRPNCPECLRMLSSEN